MRLAGRPRRFWAVAALPILAIFDQRASDEGHFRRPAAASASKKGIFMIIASPHDDQRRSSHGGHFFSCTRRRRSGVRVSARAKLRPTVFCSCSNFFSSFGGQGARRRRQVGRRRGVRWAESGAGQRPSSGNNQSVDRPITKPNGPEIFLPPPAQAKRLPVLGRQI